METEPKAARQQGEDIMKAIFYDRYGSSDAMQLPEVDTPVVGMSVATSEVGG